VTLVPDVVGDGVAVTVAVVVAALATVSFEVAVPVR